MDATLLAKGIIIVAWFAALAFGERLLPAAPRPPHSAGRLVRNVSLFGANTLMNPFIILPISIAAASFQLWTRPTLPFWPGLALDLLIMDCWSYLWHRANHESRFLWRFHRVHHLDRFLDTTSAARFHPGEVLISALARAPIIILADVQITSLAVFDTLVFLAAVFHHSNVRLPHRFEETLRLLIVTPSHHWVHHHVARADTDSNYGAIFTIWDRLFASWSPHARTRDMPIGAGDEPDEALPALAVAPFVAQPTSQ